MRSVHFADTHLPRRDGVVTSLQALTGALASAGHATLTVVPRHPQQPDATPADDLRQELRLHSVPSGVADLRLAPWPRARQVVRVANWAPDVVHVHTPGPVGLLGIMTARRLGCPLVQTYHTDLHAYADAYRIPARLLRVVLRLYAWRLGVPRLAVPRAGGDDRRAILDAANELLLGDCDAVVVPTRAVLRRGRLPVPDHQVTVVPTGVAPLAVAPGAAAAFRGGHGIDPGGQVVLFVGRVHREKGVDLLLRAFAGLLAQRPMTRLVLVGAVYDERWLRGLLVETGVGDRTVLVGQQPPAVVAAAYAAADVFAFPSLTDTQGLVVQEAALASLPVVMVDPDLRAAGPLGAAAVLAEPNPADFAAALCDVLADPVRAAEWGRAAWAQAAPHTPQRYAATMLAVYQRVRDTRRGTRRPARVTPLRRAATKVRLSATAAKAAGRFMR